jgi:WD40 repeat protein
VWRGTLGAFYWNGKYWLKNRENAKEKGGLVEVVIVPVIPLPELPMPSCTPNPCHKGICSIVNWQIVCHCQGTGYGGDRCQYQLYGFHNERDSAHSYVTYDILPPRSTSIDEIRVLFQTYYPDNPIARFIGPNGIQYYEIFMEGGRLYLSSGQSRMEKMLFCERDDIRFNNADLYTIYLVREGQTFSVDVYDQSGRRVCHRRFDAKLPSNDLLYHRIVLGADKNLQTFFRGAYGGFLWNGFSLIDELGNMNAGVNKQGDIVIRVLPVKFPPPPIPTILGPNGAGVIIGSNPPIISHGDGAGFGMAMVVGGGPAVKTAALFALPGYGILWWAPLLALLLLLSALIWAFYRCKPGWCPCCLGGKGGWLAGPKAASAVKEVYPMSTPDMKEKNPLLMVQGNGRAHVDVQDMTLNQSTGSLQEGGAAWRTKTGPASVTGVPIGQNSFLDINKYEVTGLSTMQINRPVFDEYATMSDRQNVYFSEDMKVDCCVISYNSKYVVTGSMTGPPQVWDMVSGDLFKVMDGMEFGCTDLHLACADAILVGQVHDEVTEGLQTPGPDGVMRRVRKLQLWDFVSGAQIDMPEEIFVTATCVSHDSELVIAARVLPNVPGQSSIVVWDILSNQTRMEIFYNPLNPTVKDAVTFLKVSMDDRYVVAGFENPETHNAHYMVFDLQNTAMHQQPLFVIFNAKVQSTEILNQQEAITGTQKGELIVWNLSTGRPIREITHPSGVTAHMGTIHVVSLSHDRQYLVTGASDRLVRVWSMADEQLLHTLEGHADDVLSATISLYSEIVVSGSWDGSIRVWRIRDGSQMCWFTSNIEILNVKLSNDKHAIVALGERNNHRKLIMLQIVRNRTRRTRQRMGPPGSPRSPPHSAHPLI